MRIRLLMMMAAITLMAAGCGVGPLESAPTGAAPLAVGTPVGPVPGPPMTLNLGTNPFAEDRVALAEGRRLFVWYNCVGCHGSHAGGGMGPSLRDVDWIYGNSDAHVFDSIVHGRAHGMPAWGTKVPEEQIWKLAAYVKSLGTDLEAEPPPITRPMK